MCDMFSPERVTAVCKQYGLTPGQAMDIKNGYDFDLASHRKRAWGLGVDCTGQAEAYHWVSPVYVFSRDWRN